MVTQNQLSGLWAKGDDNRYPCITCGFVMPPRPQSQWTKEDSEAVRKHQELHSRLEGKL